MKKHATGHFSKQLTIKISTESFKIVNFTSIEASVFVASNKQNAELQRV